MADAQVNLRQALNLVDNMRRACNTAVEDARGFRDNVAQHTQTLRDIVDRLEAIRVTIGDNVVYLRQQWGDAVAAANAARAGACNPQEIADALNRVAAAADIQLNRLDDVNDALALEVDRAGLQVTGLEGENPRERPVVGGGAAQGGGRRRRRRGGYTPNPCHKRCCGTGTRFSIKRKKCVTKKRRRLRRRRR